MATVRKIKISKLCIVTVFIAFLLAIVFLPFMQLGGTAFAEGIGEASLAFTVDAGSFVSGTYLTKDVDDLPVFELTFSTLTPQTIMDTYGSELFLEYVEHTKVVDDMSVVGPTLTWTSLKTDGVAGKENFSLVNKKGYLCVEHLTTKFKTANPEAQEYRRMIYFRARQADSDNPGTYVYYYYTFPVWDVFVNLASPSDELKYELEITPHGFTPSIVTYKTELGEDGMGFSVRFKSESTQNNITSMNFSFIMLDETLAANPSQNLENWISFTDCAFVDDPYKICLAKKGVELDDRFFPNKTTLSIRYIYFQIEDTTYSPSVKYRSPLWFEIKLEPSNPPVDLQILNVNATYEGNRDYPLHISNASGLPKIWSKEGISMEVSTSIQATDVRAVFMNGILASQSVYFSYNEETLRYEANILYENISIGNDSVGMYSGELKIFAQAGDITREVSVYVHIDRTIPNINCDAKTEGGLAYNYNDPNAWSYENIIFDVIDTVSTRPISGVTYEYLSEVGWKVLQDFGSYKRVTVSRTQDIYIRATTGAGKINMLSTRARIDKKAPKLGIVAKDGINANGKQILSSNHDLGGEPLGSRRIGYAQDKLTFELFNLTTQDQTANIIEYYWKKSTEATGSYRPVLKQNNKYIFVLEEKSQNSYLPIINITINIRILAKTGLGEVKDFNVTILPSGYSVGMNLNLEDIPKVASRTGEKVNNELIMWYATALPIKFTARNNLAALGAGQYKAFSFIRGQELETTQELALIKDPSQAGVPTGSIRMVGYIDRSLKNQELGFYLVDKADNKVDMNANVTPSEKMFSPALYLDTKIPVANVEKFIVGGSGNPQKLEEGDWAKGAVQIVVEIATNTLPVSGAALFEIYANGGESGTEIDGKQTTATKIIYTINKDTKGIYKYMLRSGSGVGAEIVVEVNIDNTDIILREINAKTIDSTTGNTIKDGLAIDGSEKVSSTIRIEFDTNHQGHFVYEYIDFSMSGDPNSPDEGPIEITDTEYFDILMPAEGGEGHKRFGFRLYSKAKDQNEEVSTTGPEYTIVKFQYDTRSYNITSTPSSSGVNWITSETSITLELDADSINVAIVKYQVKIDLASAPAGTEAKWVDIVIQSEEDQLKASDNYKLTYLFPGLKWYFNEQERIGDTGVTDIGTLYAALTDEQKQYSSYNGKLYFRAISESGMPSEENHVDIKQDTSSINPIYGLHQQSGEREFDAGGWIAYSKHDFKYWDPSKNDLSKAVLVSNRAPVNYFIANTAEQPALDSSDWVPVNSLQNAYVLNPLTTTYWLKATRADTSAVSKLTINKQASENPLTISFVDAENGNLGNQENLYLFEWVEKAGITVKVKSTSKIYYWYKIGEGEWQQYFNEAMTPGAEYTDFSRSMIFVGDLDAAGEDEKAHAKVVNIKNTVRIKVTNQAGDEAILSTSFYIKIDVNYPKLDSENIIVKTASGETLDIASMNTMWHSEDLIIEISRNYQNASGVEYSYRMEGQSEYVPIGNNRINTSHMVSFPEKGGTATIVLRAEQKSHGYSKEFTLSFKIDKVVPDFLLEGVAYKSINNILTPVGGKLDSGIWVNADEVRLFIKPRLDSIAISPSRYYRFAVDEQAWTEIGIAESYKIRSLETVRIKCVTEAGREVERIFQANIDNVAPTINAGKFQNPTPPENITDPLVYNEYYIDQQITYIEDNLKSAEYNGYPLPYGHIIATNTIDNTVSYVHIVIEDLAGNKTELKFKMRPFPLTAAGDESAITLSEEHLNMLREYENQYEEAKLYGWFSQSRDEYFSSQIARLKDRVATMRKQIADFQAFLRDFDTRATFELHLDYVKMKSYWDKFYSGDPLIEYPQWQQEQIVEGYTSQFEKFKAEYNRLLAKMVSVIRVQKSIALLPATNVVEASDYQNVMAVYAKYIELASDQKAVFNSNLKNKIVELKRICEVYLLQDNETGVKIYGETLVSENPGKQLEVESIDKNSEVFITTQDYLMQTQTSDKARSVISINTLSLSGTGSSYELGTFDITLTIPEEYRQYKLFAVYKRSPDRTLHVVENIQRTPDGKQIVFASQELGTYVLAASSNIQPRSDSGEIYGTIGGIDIDAKILTYITFAVIGIFVVFVAVMVLIGIRRHRFLAKYNKAHKGALVKRGIDKIPKGNPAPASNPARPEERVPTEKIVRYKTRKAKSKIK